MRSGLTAGRSSPSLMASTSAVNASASSATPVKSARWSSASVIVDTVAALPRNGTCETGRGTAEISGSPQFLVSGGIGSESGQSLENDAALGRGQGREQLPQPDQTVPVDRGQ